MGKVNMRKVNMGKNVEIHKNNLDCKELTIITFPNLRNRIPNSVAREGYVTLSLAS
jgi:hypothetical protein